MQEIPYELQISNLEKHQRHRRLYQYVMNPAYNKDCGPVSILSMRMHLDF